MLEIERIGFWEEIKIEVPQTNNEVLTSDTIPERMITIKES